MARRRNELVKADAENRLPQERAGRRDSADGGNGALLPGVPAGRMPAPHGGVGEIEILDDTEVLEGAEFVDGPGQVLAERPEDVLAEPPDARDISAELAAPPRRKMPWLTLLLSAGVVAVAAFSGGALVEKHHVNGSTTAGRGGFTAPTGAAGGRTFGGFGAAGGAGAGTGASGGTGAASGVTIGTVKLVDGKTLYVTDAQGNIVKVTTGGSTKVTESKDGKISDLKAGQSVTVLGSKNSDGDVTATTVTQGSSTASGFGGFGGGAAGGGGGGTGGSGN
jgi:hypothetical protein